MHTCTLAAALVSSGDEERGESEAEVVVEEEIECAVRDAAPKITAAGKILRVATRVA